jgi:spermidine/putrescine transport system permease protein
VLLVFIPLMGDYITATVLGGAKGNMVGQLVASQFQTAQNWALGSAMAVLLMLVIMVTIGVAAALIWLVALPFRSRNTLVLGPPQASTRTDAPAPAPAEVMT